MASSSPRGGSLSPPSPRPTSPTSQTTRPESPPAHDFFPKWLLRRPDFQELYNKFEADVGLLALRRMPPDTAQRMAELEGVADFTEGNSTGTVGLEGGFSHGSDQLVHSREARTDDDMAQIASWMERMEIFALLGKDKLVKLARHARHVVREAGEVIVKQGEVESSYIMIFSGSALVTEETIVGDVGVLRKGDGFGEQALLHAGFHAVATVTALERTELLELLQADYHRVLHDQQEAELLESTVPFMRELPLFETWLRSRLLRLCSVLERQIYPRNTTIVRQGEIPEAMYFLKAGSCVVRQDVAIVKRNRWPVGKAQWEAREARFVRPLEINVLHQGEYFGAEAVLFPEEGRRASVVTRTVSTVLVLHRRHFVHLLQGSSRTLELLKANLQRYHSEAEIRAQYEGFHAKELLWKARTPAPLYTKVAQRTREAHRTMLDREQAEEEAALFATLAGVGGTITGGMAGATAPEKPTKSAIDVPAAAAAAKAAAASVAATAARRRRDKTKSGAQGERRRRAAGVLMIGGARGRSKRPTVLKRSSSSASCGSGRGGEKDGRRASNSKEPAVSSPDGDGGPVDLLDRRRGHKTVVGVHMDLHEAILMRRKSMQRMAKRTKGARSSQVRQTVDAGSGGLPSPHGGSSDARPRVGSGASTGSTGSAITAPPRSSLFVGEAAGPLMGVVPIGAEGSSDVVDGVLKLNHPPSRGRRRAKIRSNKARMPRITQVGGGSAVTVPTLAASASTPVLR